MSRQNIIDSYTDTTKEISIMVRYIGFGLVAVSYGILTTENKIFSTIIKQYSSELVAVMIIGIFAVLFDYFQYLFKLMSINEALKDTDNKYNNDSFWYKGAKCFFKLKQIATIIGVSLLITLVVIALL